MGGGRWDPDAWKGYTDPSTVKSRGLDPGAYTPSAAVGSTFKAHMMDPALDPKGIKVRESCDSADNPQSTAVIVGLDVTGSMGMIADNIAKDGLPILFKEIYDRKPITDPHIMFHGIGDVEANDAAPLQVSQFEADIRLSEQLEKLYMEHGGGGNSYESYALSWYFAARHTKLDCFDKRKIKGYLFTVGDEGPTPYLRDTDIDRVMGYKPQTTGGQLDIDTLLTEASRQWEIFHVIVAQGDYVRSHGEKHVRDRWNKVLGQRALWLTDYTKLAEVIVSTIQVVEGENTDAVVDSWDGSTALAVRTAVTGLSRRASAGGEVVSL